MHLRLLQISHGTTPATIADSGQMSITIKVNHFAVAERERKGSRKCRPSDFGTKGKAAYCGAPARRTLPTESLATHAPCPLFASSRAPPPHHSPNTSRQNGPLSVVANPPAHTYTKVHYMSCAPGPPMPRLAMPSVSPVAPSPGTPAAPRFALSCFRDPCPFPHLCQSVFICGARTLYSAKNSPQLLRAPISQLLSPPHLRSSTPAIIRPNYSGGTWKISARARGTSPALIPQHFPPSRIPSPPHAIMWPNYCALRAKFRRAHHQTPLTTHELSPCRPIFLPATIGPVFKHRTPDAGGPTCASSL